MLNFPMDRNEWARMMDFATRYDADFDEMQTGKMPYNLLNGVTDLQNLASDITSNGRLPDGWGNSSTDRAAQRAALRILSRVVAEMTLALDMETTEEATEEGAPEEAAPAPSDPRFEADGSPTKPYFKKCHAALFDVAEFMQYVMEGEEMNLISCIDSTLQYRRAFALAQEALTVGTLAFEDALGDLEEEIAARRESIVGPLPPEPDELSDKGEGGAAQQSE